MPIPAAWQRLVAHRNYRLYFASSTIGAFASTVQFLAHGWLVLSIAPGGAAVASYLGTQFAVKVLLAVPSGVLADRFPRRSIYAWMRVLSGVASLAGAGAVFSPTPLLTALSAAAIASAAYALDLPAHRALMCEVQPREQLERGLSLGSSGFHVAALLAPVAAFPLSATWGPSMPLLLSSLGFFVAAIPAFAITQGGEPRRGVEHPARDAWDALRFIASSPLVILPLALSSLPPVLGKVLQIALPAASGHEGDGSFGLVLAATELGAISAGLLMAGVDWRFSPWMPPLSAAAYCACIIAVGIAIPQGGVAMAAALFLSGCTKTALIASSVLGIQHYTPREMHGRLMTI
jgi:MFS family permease